MLYFHQYLGMIPIVTHIFQKGLVQPPTRHGLELHPDGCSEKWLLLVLVVFVFVYVATGGN